MIMIRIPPLITLFTCIWIFCSTNAINIDTSLSHSHACSKTGSCSASDATAAGVDIGIKHKGHNDYQSLGSHHSADSWSQSSGEDAPLTFADAGSASYTNGTIKGNAGAGHSGGEGADYAESYSDTEEIDIGGGLVIQSNLNTSKPHKKVKYPGSRSGTKNNGTSLAGNATSMGGNTTTKGPKHQSKDDSIFFN